MVYFHRMSLLRIFGFDSAPAVIGAVVVVFAVSFVYAPSESAKFVWE